MASPMSLFRKAFVQRTPATLHATRIRYASTGDPNDQRDAQKDREKMDTQANEYSKSGTDDAAAKDGAFDPNTSNDPDQARKELGGGGNDSPLDVSPANPELSSGTSEVSPGADKKTPKQGDSSGDKQGRSST